MFFGTLRLQRITDNQENAHSLKYKFTNVNVALKNDETLRSKGDILTMLKIYTIFIGGKERW